MAHPWKRQAAPLTSRRNPTPGSEAICSPAIYPPGEAQHLLIKNISIMVNDLIFFPLIRYDDRCKGKMRLRCFCNMLPALRCLEHPAFLHGAGMGGTSHPASLPPPPIYTDYTLVLDGKSYHLQFQIKACSSAHGKYHQEQLRVPSKMGH